MRPVHKADNVPTSCAVVTKSGDLNFPEPSGLVQAYKCYELLMMEIPAETCRTVADINELYIVAFFG